MNLSNSVSRAISDLTNSKIVINDNGIVWSVVIPNIVFPEFLKWMRHNYTSFEDVTWQVRYEGLQLSQIEITDEKIMTMVNLRWL